MRACTRACCCERDVRPRLSQPAMCLRAQRATALAKQGQRRASAYCLVKLMLKKMPTLSNSLRTSAGACVTANTTNLCGFCAEGERSVLKVRCGV